MVIATLTMNPTIDKGAKVDRVLAERKLRCHSLRYEPGGGGVNVSRAIRHLGGESIALYTSGGPPGEMLHALLESEGVEHRQIPVKDWTRENLIVFEETTGQQYRFGMPGPYLSEEEWRRALDALSALDPKPDYLVASGSLPPGAPNDFYARAAQLGKQIGARVIVDTSGEPLRLTAQGEVYLLKPNLRELGQLAGEPLTDEARVEQAAQNLLAEGHCEAVVVSLGAAGVMLVSREGSERLRAPIVPVVSKVGAGDSTVAGLVSSLARGWSLRDAVRFGVAAGAAAVMTPGTELCRREDVERLFDRMISGR